MTRINRLIIAVAAIAGLSSLAAPASADNDIPTVERVEFVLECMRSNSTAPRQEMLYKCSCTLDQLAKVFTRDQFVDGMTAANAMSIGGERGAVLRDSEGAKTEAAGYRAVLAKAKKDCFLN
ncbi:MAG: hypothetical protein FIA96_15775 [Betaproteobacteria bacterium]|nr:hypothetical protein [Betaproteobacteria bacterium]